MTDTLLKIEEIVNSPYEFDYTVILERISEYFASLTDLLKSSKDLEKTEFELLKLYEDVYLVLTDNMCFIPRRHRKEIEGLIEKLELNEKFAVFNMLELGKDYRNIEIKKTFAQLMKIIPISLIGVNTSDVIKGIEPSDPIMSDKDIIDIRVALHRISKIIKHSLKSSSESIYSDIEFGDYFNPNFIDKKILVQRLNLLESELRRQDQSEEIKELINTVDIIRNEVKKKRPLWMRVISMQCCQV